MPRPRAADDSSARSTALERFLAAAATLFVGLALVGFAATLVQLALADTWTWLQDAPWTYLFAVPAIMLPLGFVCVVALLIVSAVRKGRGRA